MRARSDGASRNGRAGRNFRTWLACLSLLLQLAATAGHFHREDFVLTASAKATASSMPGSTSRITFLAIVLRLLAARVRECSFPRAILSHWVALTSAVMG